MLIWSTNERPRKIKPIVTVGTDFRKQKIVLAIKVYDIVNGVAKLRGIADTCFSYIKATKIAKELAKTIGGKYLKGVSHDTPLPPTEF